jgi:hypothetical protein
MKYRIDVGPFAFGPGFVLRLTEEQAASRMHRLVHRTGSDFEVVDKPVEFKTGEIVEVVAGDIGRAGQDRLVNLDADRIDREARRRSEKDRLDALDVARQAGERTGRDAAAKEAADEAERQRLDAEQKAADEAEAAAKSAPKGGHRR